MLMDLSMFSLATLQNTLPLLATLVANDIASLPSAVESLTDAINSRSGESQVMSMSVASSALTCPSCGRGVLRKCQEAAKKGIEIFVCSARCGYSMRGKDAI